MPQLTLRPLTPAEQASVDGLAKDTWGGTRTFTPFGGPPFAVDVHEISVNTRHWGSLSYLERSQCHVTFEVRDVAGQAFYIPTAWDTALSGKTLREAVNASGPRLRINLDSRTFHLPRSSPTVTGYFHASTQSGRIIDGELRRDGTGHYGAIDRLVTNNQYLLIRERVISPQDLLFLLDSIVFDPIPSIYADLVRQKHSELAAAEAVLSEAQRAYLSALTEFSAR